MAQYPRRSPAAPGPDDDGDGDDNDDGGVGRDRNLGPDVGPLKRRLLRPRVEKRVSMLRSRLVHDKVSHRRSTRVLWL